MGTEEAVTEGEEGRDEELTGHLLIAERQIMIGSVASLAFTRYDVSRDGFVLTLQAVTFLSKISDRCLRHFHIQLKSGTQY
jgi:hypothetical protein